MDATHARRLLAHVDTSPDNLARMTDGEINHLHDAATSALTPDATETERTIYRAIADAIRAEQSTRDYDEEDCPYCDGTGDNRTDPDYAYPMPCYACGGSGISRVAPPASEEEWEDEDPNNPHFVI